MCSGCECMWLHQIDIYWWFSDYATIRRILRPEKGHGTATLNKRRKLPGQKTRCRTDVPNNLLRLHIVGNVTLKSSHLNKVTGKHKSLLLHELIPIF